MPDIYCSRFFSQKFSFNYFLSLRSTRNAKNPLNCKYLLPRPVKRFPFSLMGQLPLLLLSKSHEPAPDVLVSAKEATWNYKMDHR